MIEMQGADQGMWLAVEFAVTLLAVVGTWYIVIIGRDRSRGGPKSEPMTVRYGDVEEARAPVPKFLVWTYVGAALWSVVYLLWTGYRGIGY